ncbi:aminotransferase class I/II-fold pyridoxal phosphate-dependent enzyme [Arthrobacter sp. BL-252-APC-1A]|uniref:aminotransferase class I/II-fold pyridoxal phosphate-dependent enzyme n=1 Tax=Arthrobacter sp. BL-252-APC-1A TaxID=2606622 RepID=UPI0012B31E59|nr:aminotransferase class I/II-fold pyridoxal phosphate-dependent enzyme [Arthrobacter sp. BL-252-APC-1A]MSS00130.1 aminotransferase class I/II-fold pyridoxal phosphate-dependent enzyme [Arthrobacter sp. BL-252-APC-1A]
MTSTPRMPALRDSLDGSPAPWQRTAAGANLLGADGNLGITIFEEITALAGTHGAINLGQGFPDEDGPAEIRNAARKAILAGMNQYAPGQGLPVLREAIAEHQDRFYGLQLDPATQVLVSTGATEAIASTLLALTGPGDEVLTFEPFYDSYGAIIGLSGAAHTTAPLLAPDFLPDLDALEAAFTDRTRVVLVNNPHNPTGAVFPAEVLQRIVDLAVRHNTVIVTDEVYEHLTFGPRHIPVATLPGAADRTITISSAGKTFSLTGWKIGWLSGPADLVAAIRTIKTFLTYSSGTPFQAAIAGGLRMDDSFFTDIAGTLRAKRNVLSAGLRAAGLDVFQPQGTYFVNADVAPLGITDATDLARRLPGLVGVAAIPVAMFCHPEGAERTRTLLRFAFCKRFDVLQEAAERISRLGEVL